MTNEGTNATGSANDSAARCTLFGCQWFNTDHTGRDHCFKCSLINCRRFGQYHCGKPHIFVSPDSSDSPTGSG